MLGLAGVTWIDTKVAAVTVRVVLPEIAAAAGRDGRGADARGAGKSRSAGGVADAWPPLGLEEAQVTCCVRSWVELSEKTPVAVNCSVSPLGRLGFAGVTSMRPAPRR